MARSLTFTEELVVEVCWCGMHHAIPTGLRDHMKSQHQNGEKQVGVYCPLGHNWIFSGKAEVEVERELRKEAEAQAIALRDQLDAEKRSYEATRKRIEKGVCPCCHRSFVNVARHMASKHEGYGEKSVCPTCHRSFVDLAKHIAAKHGDK